MIYAVEVAVTLKPVVNDPQGLVVRDGLRQLGFAQVLSARVGKVIALEMEAASDEEARSAVVEMCEKLLRNPVIEDYQVYLGADAPGGGSTPTPASAAGVRPDASVPPVPRTLRAESP